MYGVISDFIYHNLNYIDTNKYIRQKIRIYVFLSKII